MGDGKPVAMDFEICGFAAGQEDERVCAETSMMDTYYAGKRRTLRAVVMRAHCAIVG